MFPKVLRGRPSYLYTRICVLLCIDKIQLPCVCARNSCALRLQAIFCVKNRKKNSGGGAALLSRVWRNIAPCVMYSMYDAPFRYSSRINAMQPDLLGL